ncbi:putative pectinesterase 53 [Vitis vinifera]|uniref:pectinesterase n=1 Tax=Vitis vinifera TaxID=29760 RepID=A0A438II75_VITVI|nr:putative pectinesterase 53 [Vitis vinifera]
MSKFQCVSCVAILLFLLNSTPTHCHTKGIRPKNSAGKRLSTNMTQTQFAEQQFMKWVRFVGSLRHSMFKAAKNKLFPSYAITVNKNSAAGDFRSIQDAIDSLPSINLVRVVIKVHAGVYTEKVNIPAFKSFITIEGAGADKTVVQWGDTARTIGEKGQPIGTFNSATFAVNSLYFIAKNITFKNTTPVPAPGAVGKQAVAFRISGDTAAFLGCKFLGAQDTLYDHLGMSRACHSTKYRALTAQGRSSLLEDTGFSFVNCKVTGSGALFLGRAWGPFSRVVFAYTYMDDIIIPKGWYNWGDPSREMTVFYGQYKCTGPGAAFAGRVSWSRELTDQEAKPFISLSYIDGSEWIKM